MTSLRNSSRSELAAEDAVRKVLAIYGLTLLDFNWKNIHHSYKNPSQEYGDIKIWGSARVTPDLESGVKTKVFDISCSLSYKFPSWRVTEVGFRGSSALSTVDLYVDYQNFQGRGQTFDQEIFQIGKCTELALIRNLSGLQSQLGIIDWEDFILCQTNLPVITTSRGFWHTPEDSFRVAIPVRLARREGCRLTEVLEELHLFGPESAIVIVFMQYSSQDGFYVEDEIRVLDNAGRDRKHWLINVK